MRISVLGLGYVGCVSAACFADLGNEVVGLDVDARKLAPLREGRSPIVEPGLADLVKRGVGEGRLTVTEDYEAAVMGTDVSLVCVGTPSTATGGPNLTYTERVCEQIADVVCRKDSFHTIVFRSTIPPGTVETRLIPILESRSGKKAGEGFGVCFNPEFLREASAVKDFHHPPKIVIGETSPGSRAGDVLVELYASIDAPTVRTEIRVSEMVKYADNCFHAIKVCFANEIGNLSKALGISDSHKVMDIFCLDTQLNLSPYYLKPGFAFGGSCLPKDLRAIVRMSHDVGVPCPVLSAADPSNQLQIKRAIDTIRGTGKRKVGVLGMSFKAETDDLRESPIVQVVSTLIGKGYELCIYDRNISWEQLFGSNLGFLEHELPYARSLKANSVDDLIARAEVLVIANGSSEFADVHTRMREDQIMVDLVRILDDPSEARGEYIGISW
ncbi:MAG: UDP-glucose/GDP-mannose dehydrogenase family protein [Candidatus Eisenbacteria bacterium]|nr:UDP-glucose/GDP-mannose dehydrogenase family protein [Candidatus Eisenbacteria bacterium]